MAVPEQNKLLSNYDFEAYKAAPGINNSGLVQLLRSPAHYHYWRSAPPREPTPALVLGAITHLCVLEPDVYEERVRLAPQFKARKGVTLAEQKASWHRRLPKHATVVTQDQHDKARAMRDAVWRNPEARALLARGHREASIWWQDPLHQVLCKARLDFVSLAVPGGVVLDLKTTQDASRLKFSRSVVEYRYDMQAAHYLAAGQATGCFGAEDFYFLAVEKDPPHAAVVYQLAPRHQGVGQQWREEAMSRYAQALRANAWPGLPHADEIGIPKWAKAPGEAEEMLLD